MRSTGTRTTTGTRLPTSVCVQCGKEVNAATCIDNPGHQPAPGDITLCVYCGTPHEFNDILVLKPLSAEQLSGLPVNVQQLIEAVREHLRTERERRP